MPDWTILIPAFTSLLSAGAAVLAWLAKLRWSQEFAAAKDETIKAKDAQIVGLHDQFAETIRAKDAQIEALRELTPMKIREYFVSVKQWLEEYIDKLKADLAEAQGKNEQLQQELVTMQVEQIGDKTRLLALEVEHEAVNQKLITLRHQLEKASARSRDLDMAKEAVDILTWQFSDQQGFFEEVTKVHVAAYGSSDDAPTQPLGATNSEPEAN